MSPTEIVQAQLDAYNARDLGAFCALFAPDCVLAALNGPETERGIDAVRARYAALFAAHPRNHARLLNRIAVADVVIDHEHITRDPGGEAFEAGAIYTIRGGRIARVDFFK